MSPAERRSAQIQALAMRMGNGYYAQTEGIAGWFDHDDAYSELDYQGMAMWGLGSLLAYLDETEPEVANALRYGLRREYVGQWDPELFYSIDYPAGSQDRIDALNDKRDVDE